VSKREKRFYRIREARMAQDTSVVVHDDSHAKLVIIALVALIIKIIGF
jgi:hypothetical protein